MARDARTAVGLTTIVTTVMVHLMEWKWRSSSEIEQRREVEGSEAGHGRLAMLAVMVDVTTAGAGAHTYVKKRAMIW